MDADFRGQAWRLMVQRLSVLCTSLALLMGTVQGNAASKDLGNGFQDHGVAVPISNHRGSVATVDGNGRNVLLLWLMDYRGGYELLLIDVETGKSEEFPVPFKNPDGDSPYASILSSTNKFYTHFADNFIEFDPIKRAYTFHSKTAWQMSMGMTEDDEGLIWSVSYPKSGVVSWNPKTREFRDFGHVYEQNWPQYQRHVAADDAGWVYFALGMTASQIVAFDPVTSTAKPMLPEGERQKGTAYLYRDQDGKVYGQAHPDAKTEWYEFHKGVGKKIGKHETIRPKPFITGNQGLFHSVFPDGTRVESCNLVERKLRVQDAGTSKIRELSFDYKSEGAEVMGLAAAPDGTICGGTAFPMRFFTYDPKTDKLINRQAYMQFNTVAPLGDRFFVGGYPGGFLLEWDPARPWVNTEVKNPKTNPLFHTQVSPTIHRPHCLLATSDGKMVIMGGTPEYGYTGGGLLLWDRQSRTHVLLKDTDIIPDQSTHSIIELPGGKLLGGTTTSAGTGGEKKAKEAELYIMDRNSTGVQWHAAVLPGVQSYTDLHMGPAGLVYGFADAKLFFVFDPVNRAVVYQKDVEGEFGRTVTQQGPRVFIETPDKAIYILFTKAIVRLEPEGHKLKLVAKSPVTAECGGDYYEGRIYFAERSHLCSYRLPTSDE